jgi:hypothetical protein
MSFATAQIPYYEGAMKELDVNQLNPQQPGGTEAR